MTARTCVLDASALLAWLQTEAGGDQIDARLSASAISAVNWSEVVQRADAHAVDTSGLHAEMGELGVTVLPFDVEDAELAAGLRPLTIRAGLSLADRACLALAAKLKIPAITADRAWKKLDLSVEIVVIR